MTRLADHQAWELGDKEFEDFRRIIETRLGIRMPHSKKAMLQSRLAKRMRTLRLKTLTDYHRWVFAGGGFRESELPELYDAATTNKTDFYREPAHFAFLKDVLIHQWRAAKPTAVFRMWSAGCSSGEEPYTFAMALESCRQNGRFEFSILASDISMKALRTARAAAYPPSAVAPLPQEWQKRFLEKIPSSRGHTLMRVKEELRRRVRLGRLNFLASRYVLPHSFNLISFRNVMIYFDQPTREAVVRRLCEWLEPGGYFFSGHSESLQGMDVPLIQVQTAIYRKPAH